MPAHAAPEWLSSWHRRLADRGRASTS
jgi:hypothetical protein